jgi:hypothetical protein
VSAKKFFLYNGPRARCTIGERELHCGDCFKIVDGPDVRHVRIEHNGDWIIVGVGIAEASYWHRHTVEEYP